MDKVDTRFQKLRQLHERRKQVVRLHLRGTGVMQNVSLTGLSHPTVRKAADLFVADGWAAVEPAARGCSAGEGRLLSAEQGATVRRTIFGTRPEPLKMEFALQTRGAVIQYVERAFGVKTASCRINNSPAPAARCHWPAPFALTLDPRPSASGLGSELPPAASGTGSSAEIHVRLATVVELPGARFAVSATFGSMVGEALAECESPHRLLQDAEAMRASVGDRFSGDLGAAADAAQRAGFSPAGRGACSGPLGGLVYPAQGRRAWRCFGLARRRHGPPGHGPAETWNSAAA